MCWLGGGRLDPQRIDEGEEEETPLGELANLRRDAVGVAASLNETGKTPGDGQRGARPDEAGIEIKTCTQREDCVNLERMADWLAGWLTGLLAGWHACRATRSILNMTTERKTGTMATL